jgi:acylphosphatase
VRRALRGEVARGRRAKLNQRRLEASVRGVVQGVGFRYFVLHAGRSLGLSGTVVNRYDGSVEVVAEGPEDRLEMLLERLREGPRSARVEEVEAHWGEATGRFTGFEVGF